MAIKTVLFIEDTLPWCELYSEALEGLPCAITFAHRWDTALARFNEGGWAIIITDDGLPGNLDASSFCKIARDRGYAGKIVVCSGMWRLTLEEAQSWGADAIIPKMDPEWRHDLRALVEGFLSERN